MDFRIPDITREHGKEL